MGKKKIYGLLPFRCVIFAFAFFGLSFATRQSLVELSKWWPVIAIALNLLTIALLCILSKGHYGAFIHFKKFGTKLGPAAAATVVTLVVGMGGMYLAGFIVYGKFPYLDQIMAQPLPVATAVTCALLLPISTTLAEDGLYLGAIQQTDGDLGVTLISAFCYGAQHVFIPMLPDTRFVIYRFLCFLPLALTFCFWYRKRRDPLPFMIGHFVINLATASTLVAAAFFPDLFTAS